MKRKRSWSEESNFQAVYAIGLVSTLVEPLATVKLDNPIIINHTRTNISSLAETAVKNAKNKLIIAYGHTSHGSQIVTGMDGLMDFKGDLYSFNSNGSDGAENAFDDTNPAAAKEPIPAVLRNALRFALFMAYLSG